MCTFNATLAHSTWEAFFICPRLPVHDQGTVFQCFAWNIHVKYILHPDMTGLVWGH